MFLCNFEQEGMVPGLVPDNAVPIVPVSGFGAVPGPS